MILLLSRIFIKDYKNTEDAKVRTSYGIICAIFGIILNVLLFAFKILLSFFASSVSILADALNNLSDAGSSLVTLFGFVVSRQKPDKEHPFGHGRMEYISGLVVSIIIILMAFELFHTSIAEIFNPSEINISIWALIIMIISVFVKIYMSSYNFFYGKRLGSATLKATALDSASDVLATSVVIASAVIYYFYKINIDAYAGIVVSLFVLRAGINALKETSSPLLGTKPDPELVEKIENIVKKQKMILGYHDLIIHDYGPNRRMLSLHAEVDYRNNLVLVHDVIDEIESEIENTLGIDASIHVDPVQVDNEVVDLLKAYINDKLSDIDKRLKYHDFRVTAKEEGLCIIFELPVPFDCKYKAEDIDRIIAENLAKDYPQYKLTIKFETEML